MPLNAQLLFCAAGVVNRILTMKRRRAFTLIEILVVSIILGLIASIGWPVYNKMVKKARFKEVKIMVDLVISGAKVYDMKYGINSILINSETGFPSTQEERWDYLNIQLPPAHERVCDYEISQGGSAVDLWVYSDPEKDGTKTTKLYWYKLPYGNSQKYPKNPDSAYLPPDMP